MLLFIVLHVLIQVNGGWNIIILHVPQFDISPGTDWDAPQGNSEMYNDRYKWQIPISIIRLRKGLEGRRQVRPLVEVGPGFFKSEILSYPHDELALQFKKLLLLKEKMKKKKT